MPAWTRRGLFAAGAAVAVRTTVFDATERKLYEREAGKVPGVPKETPTLEIRRAAVVGAADVQPVAHRPLADGGLEADLLHPQRADVREPVGIARERLGRSQDRPRDVVASGPGVVPVRDRDPAVAGVGECGHVAARPHAAGAEHGAAACQGTQGVRVEQALHVRAVV